MDIEHTDELVFFVNGKKVSEIEPWHEISNNVAL